MPGRLNPVRRETRWRSTRQGELDIGGAPLSAADVSNDTQPTSLDTGFRHRHRGPRGTLAARQFKSAHEAADIHLEPAASEIELPAAGKPGEVPP
ncbi:MAG: hypothetical protein HOQ33_21630 [Cupriavidus sp.]|nr:hypothetical protein [Cupriavidus sp.]NUT17081.1 hypothetical protein [Cupriavidus sp.]